MSRFDRSPVPVVIGPCECPGTPHDDGDVVYLAPAISLAGGMAAQGAILDSAGDAVRLQERLAGIWLRHGVVGWNLLDADGKPVPLTPENVEAALPYGKGGSDVADKADDLYAEAVMRPLLARLKSRSPTGPTGGSTSPTRRRTRKQSAPSSPVASEASPPSTT